MGHEDELHEVSHGCISWLVFLPDQLVFTA